MRWTIMRGRAGSVFGEGVVGIAVQPALASLGGGDDGMAAAVRVRGGVAVRRGVAAERPLALLARSQMDPLRADLDALLAFAALRARHFIDGAQVRAGPFVLVAHGSSAEHDSTRNDLEHRALLRDAAAHAVDSERHAIVGTRPLRAERQPAAVGVAEVAVLELIGKDAERRGRLAMAENRVSGDEPSLAVDLFGP